MKKRTFRAVAVLGLVISLLAGSSLTSMAATNSISKTKAETIALKTVNVKRAKAKSIALKTAKVKKSAVKKWIKIKLDNYDNDSAKEWDIEFRTKNYKFEIEINARTGKVEDFEKEKIRTTSSVYIGVDKAKSIALKHAGVSGSVKYTKAKLDKDDGVSYYDIEFKKNGKDYEYEIHAKTGKILDWDIEVDD